MFAIEFFWLKGALIHIKMTGNNYRHSPWPYHIKKACLYKAFKTNFQKSQKSSSKILNRKCDFRIFWHKNFFPLVVWVRISLRELFLSFLWLYNVCTMCSSDLERFFVRIQINPKNTKKCECGTIAGLGYFCSKLICR